MKLSQNKIILRWKWKQFMNRAPATKRINSFLPKFDRDEQ